MCAPPTLCACDRVIARAFTVNRRISMYALHLRGGGGGVGGGGGWRGVSQTEDEQFRQQQSPERHPLCAVYGGVHCVHASYPALCACDRVIARAFTVNRRTSKSDTAAVCSFG